MEGISGAYAIGDLLGHKKNSISLITTHFHELSKLSTSQPNLTSNCHNYQFLFKQQKVEILSIYKIKPGVSNQPRALKLLSKGFDQNRQLAEKTCRQLSKSKNADKKEKYKIVDLYRMLPQTNLKNHLLAISVLTLISGLIIFLQFKNINRRIYRLEISMSTLSKEI